MTIDPHLRFARMGQAFLRAFGTPEEMEFTRTARLPDSDPAFAQAIVRSATDIMNGGMGGAGQAGDESLLAVTHEDAALLGEGDTFTHSSKTWRIAGPATRDGRAMAVFPIEVA